MWEANPGDVQRFVRAMNAHDLDSVMELFSDGALFSGGPRFDAPSVGRESIREMLQRYLASLPELLLTPRGIYVDRNEAVAVLDIVATIRGELPGVAVSSAFSGRRVSWQGAFRFLYDDLGKVKALTVYGDRSTARWLTPPPGGSPATGAV